MRDLFRVTFKKMGGESWNIQKKKTSFFWM